MKTTKIWMALVAVAFLASCGVSKPKEVTLNNQIDSLNYAFGVANGEEIAQYYLANDSTGESLKELLAGFQEGLKAKSDANPQLVELGTQIGTTLKEQTKTGLMGDDSLKVNIELIRQGLINGLRGAELGMTSAQAQEYLQTTMMSLQERRSAVENAPNREAGEAFLAENATREGVVVTESGLQYQVIKAGKGKKPTAEDRVKVHYHGTLIDGTVFDSSVDRGEPTSFGVTQVIAGWTEALQLMPVGSKWKLFIPYNLAYGERDAGTIKPYSALVFEVELLAIEK